MAKTARYTSKEKKWCLWNIRMTSMKPKRIVSRNATLRSVEDPPSFSGRSLAKMTVLWPEYLDWLFAGVEYFD